MLSSAASIRQYYETIAEAAIIWWSSFVRGHGSKMVSTVSNVRDVAIV